MNVHGFSQIALVANGAFEDKGSIRSLIQSYPFIIAVDGGFDHCLRLGILPNLIVGDLDSVSEKLSDYPHIPVQRYLTEKDQSDLELALQWADSKDVEKITVFGALGCRLDHTLANLLLLRRYPKKMHFESEREVVFSFTGSINIPCQPNQTISFFSVGEPTSGVSSSGLKWELHDASFSPSFFSLSNLCLGDCVTLTVKQGDLLCCMQKI